MTSFRLQFEKIGQGLLQEVFRSALLAEKNRGKKKVSVLLQTELLYMSRKGPVDIMKVEMYETKVI